MQMGHFLIELAFDQHLREFLYVGGIVSNKKVNSSCLFLRNQITFLHLT